MKNVFIFIFLVFIFSTFNKSISQGSSSYFSKEIDMSTSIDAIYSNINVMNNSIYNLKNQMKNLNAKISNLNKANEDLSRNLESKINLNTDEIKQLQNECNLIDIDYKTVTKQITIFEQTLDSLLSTLKEHDTDIDNLKSDLRILRDGYFELKNEFVKIPSIMFCTECYPKISISFSNNRYLTFSMDDIKAMPSYSLDATYYDTENIGFWINYISPFLVTISSKLQDSISISDHWTTNIVSGGFLYNYKPHSNNFSIRLGAGLFFGSAEFDKFMNSTVGFTRSGIKNTKTFGLDLKTEFAYSEYHLKNPLEFFVRVNGLIAYDKITLDPGINQKHDFGRVLVYISFGIKYNFWGR